MATSMRTEIGQLAVIAAMFIVGLVTLPTAPERRSRACMRSSAG